MMLKVVTLISFLCLVSMESEAQGGSVQLNVKLYPIQTLLVNPSQADVNLEYITKEDYINGVMSEQPDHLTIYSTSGFQVKVNSNENLVGTTKTISANTIAISPSAGSKPINNNNVVYTEKQLSTAEQPIIISTKGGVDRSFNINYKGAGSNMYIDYYDASDTPSVYSCNVIYTIVSQ